MKNLLCILTTTSVLLFYGYPSTSIANNKKGLFIPANKTWILAPQIHQMLKKSGKKGSMVGYNTKKTRDISASARGTDGKHHIVNSFLVGYAPFPTDNIMIPMQVMAKKKVYASDKKTYMGNREVWQTSRQAHRITQGDCEDHSIAVADWLIAMGEDARVVLGDLRGEGHAWVVLLKDGKQYLLETTNKSEIKPGESYPLTRKMRGYRPNYMFNRKLFWKYNGSHPSFDYSSSKWVLKSYYTLGSTFKVNSQSFKR